MDNKQSGSEHANLKQYLASIVATAAAFSGGMTFSWTSPVESQVVRDADGNCDYKFCMSQSEFTWMATVMSIGCLVFALGAGPLMSLVGRKPGLLVYFASVIVGWVCLTFPSAPWMLYLGRLCLGAGYAGSAVIVPIYVGEIAQVSVRGRLISFFEINFQSGVLLSYVLGYFFAMFRQTLITLIIAVVISVGLLFLPESPRYHVSKNHLDEAEKSLKRLRGPEWDVQEELRDMQLWQAGEKREGLRALFSDRVNRKALMIVFGVRAGQQLSGIMVVTFYTAGIFEEANIGINPDLASIFVGLVVVVAAFLSSYIVDKTGRRVLLLCSYSIQCLCFVVFGVYFTIQDSNPGAVEGWGFLPVVVMCLYVFMSSIGTQPVAFVIMGEIFAQNIKDVAASLSMSWNFFLTICSVLIFSFLTETYNTGVAFFVHAGFLLGAFFFALFVIPETKGKSFSEIQLLLAGDSKYQKNVMA